MSAEELKQVNLHNKKGQVQPAIYQLIYLAIGIVVVGAIIAFGANLMTDQQTSLLTGAAGCNSTAVTQCGYAYNTTVDNLRAMSDAAEGQGTITTVGILAVVVGLLIGVVALFSYLRGRDGQ